MWEGKKATALLQYAGLIALVALALTTMNLYLRRSIQAKLKEMTEAYIGRRHLVLENKDKQFRSETQGSKSWRRIKEEEGGGSGIQGASISENYTYSEIESEPARTDYGEVPSFLPPIEINREQ